MKPRRPGEPIRHYSNGLPAKLIRFYADNPDEDLTYRDIMVKFNVAYANARYAVSSLRKEGILVSAYVIRAKGSW